MNFDDTPQEAEFRAKARAFLAKHLTPLDPNETAPNLLGEREDEGAIDVGQALAGHQVRRRLGRADLAEGVRRPGPRAHGERHLQSGRAEVQNAARRSTASATACSARR